MTSAAVVAAAPAARQVTAVAVHSAEADHSVVEAHVEAVRSAAVVHVEAVRSLMAVALIVEAHTEDMVAWVVAAKLKVPAHAPQHSSYVAPRS